LDAGDDRLTLRRRLAISTLDSDMYARRLLGDSGTSLLKKFMPVGDHERSLSVRELKFIDQGGEKRRFPGPSGHDHHNPMQAAILRSQHRRLGALLVVAQNDRRSLAPDDGVVILKQVTGDQRRRTLPTGFFGG
jgi:hypothetical protein